MHAEPSDPTPDLVDQVEQAVMMVLLAGEHTPWTRSELEREISGPHRNPLDVTDAIDNLYGAGLLHITGQLVTPSRAAKRMDDLAG
jgi:hypothetical protein